ncbi:phage specificity protein [Limosilactobacillus reuteri]|uniref:phage specificity protein n=1 Tax=Limosilactobacillus reuteri TaxID=1598 RepID=UPI003993672B
MEKTIKYLENGEYHYATVRSVGDLAQLKTTSKETLVEAINELWNGGGNVDPSKVPNPEGYDKLVQDVADAVKNQQETNQQWIEWKKEEAQLTEERKQAYLQAMKEMQEAIDKAKADAAALGDKTAKLDEQITKTFSDLDTNIQNMHEQLQKEADRMNQELQDTKGALSTLRTDLQNAQLDNGKIHDELTNINGKFEHKVWQTDLDPLKAQIDRAETSVQQTKDELLGKASREDLDTVTNAVSKLDTQLKETAKGVEISVKKDELGGDVARLLNDKTNLLLGTRSFSGEDNWRNRDKVTIEPGYYKGMKTAAVQVTDASIYQPYRVKANTAYTFSFFGKEDRDNPKATLVIKPIDAQNVNVDGGEQQVHITTEWQRFAVTFSVDQECEISIQIIQGPEATNNILHLAGLKLQYGQNDTPWEPNEADVAENIEHTESQFNVYSDQIAGIVKKQEKMGDTERQLDTRITETAEGLKQTSKDLQDANGKITEFKGQLESTAHGLKTEYEKYTNDAIGQISDSTLNLIRNSSFQNKDEDFDQWQNISAKANVRSDENGLRWVELTQSGLTTNNPEGITSNYFNIKQGKVTVAVDIKSGDKASLDNDSVLSLELYNDVKKRVDFYDVSLSQLGLSKELLGDHKVHRGLYRLGIDRNDAKYMTVKAKLVKNGDLYFTNFSARLSSIDDGAYEPNPDDLNQQILKQNTKIEQNAKEVAIKANSVDVTRDIKSAVDGIQVGGVNLIKNSETDIVIESKTTDAWPAWKYKVIYYDLTPGETYTFSVSAVNTNNVKDASIRIFNEAQNKEAPGSLVFPADGKRHSTTFTLPKDGVNYSVYLYAGHMGKIEGKNFVTTFHHPQLELGNKSTSWSPAPEDTSAEIKSVKDAAIQVASDQINLRVNELSTQFDDKLNKRINEQKTASEKFTSDGIEQVVTKITNVKGDVDRLGDTVNGVGSRNLLHNTSDQYRTLTGSDWFAKSTANDIYTSVANYHGGNQFTYAATITNPSNYPVRLVIYCYDKSKSKKLKTILGAPVSANQPNARVNVTTVMDTDTWWIRTNIETLQGNTPQISIQVKDERLVEGTVSSSWSPNPDDINQQIANTNKKIDTQTLDSANIDDLRIQGHYFVRNLTGNPIGGWVYVDVTGNNNDRIRQDVYADQNNQHKYRSWNGSRWSDWEQGAYLSDVNNVKTEVTASVNNLGDRVITQVNSIKTKVDNMKIGGRNLLKGTRDFNSKYWYQSGDHTALADNPTDSSTKEIHSWLDWHSYRYNQTIQLDSNKDYMVSADIAIYDGNGDGLYVTAYGTLDGTGMALTNDVNLSGFPKTVNNEGFRRIYLPLKKRGRNLETFRIEGHGNWAAGAGSVFISKIMLYEGNTPLAWADSSDDFVEAIKEVNTKWDVANGQIQGKVTATEVNNILNGKGYATQSWAQTMFQMKSNSITLQAVRDNITNGIQNQVNDTKNQVNAAKNQISGLQNASRGDLSNICRNPNFMDGSTAGWQGVTASTGNGSSPAKYYGCIQQRDAYYGDWFTVAAGDQYFFSIFAWQDTSPNHFNFGFVYEQTDGHWNWNTSLTFTPTDHLKTKRGSITIPNNVVKARIWVQIDAQSNFGHWYFTNVVAKRNDAISAINITPDQIKIASNKIVIDGNTDIHGDLRTDRVRLVGKQGAIDMTGDTGIKLTNNDGSSMLLERGNIDLMYKNDFRMNIDSSLMTIMQRNQFTGQNKPIAILNIGSSWNHSNNQIRGADIRYNPGNVNDVNLHGADYLALSYNKPNLTPGEANIKPQLVMAYQDLKFDENHYLWRKGVNVADDLTIQEYQRINVGYRDKEDQSGKWTNDPLMIHRMQWSNSYQADRYQPTIRLGYSKDSMGHAGVTFLWDQVKPFGDRDISDLGSIWFNGQRFVFGWASHKRMFGNQQQPAFMRLDDKGEIMSGIAFTPGSTWDLGSGAWNITASVMNNGG